MILAFAERENRTTRMNLKNTAARILLGLRRSLNLAKMPLCFTGPWTLRGLRATSCQSDGRNQIPRGNPSFVTVPQTSASAYP